MSFSLDLSQPLLSTWKGGRPRWVLIHNILLSQINPRQCRKVYEILRLMHTNIHNEKEYRELRLDIKKRLNLVYFKQLRDIEKMTKVGVDTQWMTATLPSKEERLEQLHKEYKELESYYEKIIKRLKNPWN